MKKFWENIKFVGGVIGNWVVVKLWPFIKKHWKGISIFLFTLIGALVLSEIVKIAKRGKPISPLPFYPVKGDEHEVLIQDPSEGGKWTRVDLGKDTYDKVTSVGLASIDSKQIVVEIKHEIPDRTH
jgi:hypothetical protein